MPQTEDTPLMRQWRDVKSRHRDALVFFRVGDFFELFYGDAEEGSKLLGLTLTSRNNGAASKVPLAGVPAKALDEYLGRLIRVGRRVAICDQVEDASEAQGIVRREVVETVTPGTALQDAILSSRKNNFVVAIGPPAEPSASKRSGEPRARGAVRGVASLDLSTGELTVRGVSDDRLAHEVGRLEPAEVLLPSSLRDGDDAALASAPDGPLRTWRDDWLFDRKIAGEELERRFGVESLEGFGFQRDDGPLVRAAGALVAYVHEIQPAGVSHLRPPKIVRSGESMLLDEMTRRNLELVEPLRPGVQGGTLLSVIDHAVTAMGGRLLRRWVLHPLVAAAEIWRRQEAVERLVEARDLRHELRESLSDVTDLERLSGKVAMGRISPRELGGMARSLESVEEVRRTLASAFLDDDDPDPEPDRGALITDLARELDPLDDVRELLAGAIADEPPATLQEGGVIREGWSEELDEERATRDGARDFIARLQTRERERTGIGSLKVGFNKVFGYYLEVTKANLDRVPDDYHRKQTLTNAERYFTPELKEWEEKVVGAEDRIATLEAELFSEVRGRIGRQVGRLQQTADRVATLDVLAAFAEGAEKGRYVRPEVHTGFDLEIRGGRHPVVETMMPAEDFIPNDVILDEEGGIAILTGPNMAGKSTVLRQVGLIQLLAQIGAYVPADRARLPVTDRIFTRVGASDDLARGQSTFMVEMNETAAILHGATEASLVLLDEIGRGTSTYDGVSIAWAVTEHVHEFIGAKTIFATHYHELTQLGDLLPRVVNWNVAVRESGDDIVFLRLLEPGGADRSYGIQVARLAGVPRGVIARAKELLTELEGTHSGGGEGLGRRGAHRPASEPPPDQLNFFGGAREHPVLDRLRALEVDRLTPLEALNLLADLRDSLTE